MQSYCNLMQVLIWLADKRLATSFKIRRLPRDLWPEYQITWRQWRILDFIAQQDDIAESSLIVKKCSSGEDINGDEMGSIDQATVHRNLNQLRDARILTLELKKTIGGRTYRYYRINHSARSWGLTPIEPKGKPPGNFY